MYKTTNCRGRNGSANSFKSIVMLLMLFVGFGSYAQYCEVSTTYSGDYLSSITTTNALQNVSYTASSQPTGSYDDKTDQVIMQAQGLSFDISTDYVGGTNGVNVWIDFDGNEEFDDEEKVFSATGATTHSGTITIPSVVAIGEYRMRVRGQWGSSANPPACGNVSYGSTVDFTLSVTEAPDCMPPSGLTATALSLTSIELSWTSDGDSFEVEWGEAGFEQGDGTIEVVTDTSLEVTTVTDTPYEFYVRQDCGDDGYSMWAGPFSFETGYCDPTYSYGCSSGAKISNVTTSDAILNIANETGTSSCGANGYNDFTSMSASSPAEAVVGITVGVGSYSGGVKVWIDWNNNGEFETDELMAESASTITSGSSFTGSFTVPAGTSLGDYRMRVRVVEGSTSFDPCSNYNYGETEDYTFTVIEEPDCMPPTGLGIESATYTSANLSWVSSGDLFDIEWGEAGFEQGEGTMVEGVTENPYTVEGLEAETGYEFYVRQDCGDDGVSLWAGPYYFYTGYCQGSSTYTGNRIDGFSTTAGYTNISNMDNGTVNDYSNYTNLSVTQSEGGSFDYSVSVPSYTNVEIWIDFNNNLTFDTDELVAEHTYASSATIFTGTIDIPENIDEGDYRIRVRSRYYYNTAASPCNDLSYGETEDYTLTIVPEPDCLPPTELAATALSLTSMELSWTSDGDSFEVEWGEAGFEQGDGTIEVVTDTSLEVTTVIDTPYEFYVRQNCGDDGYSMWAGPFSFETGYCTPTYSYGCSSGAKISNVTTSDAILNIANETGTSSCGENGYNDFTSMSASSPAEAVVGVTVGVGSYSGGVKIWIDWNNNGTFETDELMAESASTITSGSSFTGSFTVPAGTPLGDYRIRVRVVEGNTSFDPCSNYNYGETEDYTFTVIEEPDCMPPTGLGIDGATFNSADLSWVSSGDLFDIEWGEAGFEQGEGTMVEGVTENPYTLEGLEAETGYEFYVRQDCGDDGVSLWAGPFYFFTGYCSVSTTYTGDYTSAFSTTGAFTNVTYSTSSQPAGSYSNQSAQIISQSAGLSFDFSTTYVGGSNGVNIWVDYNNNFEFEESEIVFSLANSDATKTGTITIPADTPIGEYRMRVRSQYGSTANPPACGNVTYGSTIDFTLNVVEEPDCMPPTGLGIDGATFDSADLSWVSDGDLFDIEWGETGFEQGEGAIVSGVTNPYTLEGLEAETGYEFYVRQDCGDDGVSLWAGPFYFFTGYCQGSSTYTGYRITGFSTTNGYYNILNLNNGVENSYNNYSNMVVSQSAGGSFNYAVSVPSYTNVEIWIDYNNNMIFDADELVAAHAYSSSATTFTGTINIPADIEDGDYRIRVRSRYYFNTVADPCNDVSYGETEDYTLRIEAEPDCLPPTDIEIEVTCDIPPVANVMWNPGGEETSWEYVVTLADEAEPTEGTTVNENFVQVTDLEQNEDYMFWIRSKCGDDGDSVWISIPFNSNASPVAQAQPFCAEEGGGILFENVSGVGNLYGSLSCLGSTPNPVWYYLQIDQPGDLDFEIIQNTAFDAEGNPTGTGLDVDYIAWGPFDSMQDACMQIDLDNPTLYEVDCSYSAAPVENFSITGAQEGQIYVLLITNYNGSPGYIKLHQTNIEDEGAGNTDCSFLCEVDLGEDITVCQGTEVILEGEVASAGTSTDVTETRWYHNDELIDPDSYSEDGLSITVTQSGTYRLEVEKEMCTEEVVFDEIEVLFIPAYAGQIPPTIELCDELNDGVEVFNLGQYKNGLNLGDYDIELYASMDDLNSGTNPLPDLYESGNATIYAKISSTILASCSSVQEIELILIPLETPVVEFSYDDILCYDNLDFALPYYADEFTFGGTFSSSAGLFIDSETGEIDVESSIPGTYEVLYDYKVAPGNCGEDDSFTTTVTISEPILFEMVSYCNGGETIIDATNLRVSIPLESYELTWIGAEKVSENTAVVRNTGTVTLHVEDEFGCYKEFYIEIDNTSCLITKGISPNGDGLNDRFDLSSYWVLDLKIYNRDGREVYSHGMGYTDEWEGQSNNGNSLPDGTYYYRIVTNVEELTGWVQLVRELK